MERGHGAAVAFGLLAVLLATAGFPVGAGTPDDSYKPERYFTEAASEQPTTTAEPSWADALTLSFTPPTARNFVVLASALVHNSSSSYMTGVRLYDGTTGYGGSYHQPGSNLTLNYRSWSTHRVFPNLSAATTLKVQFNTSNASGTAYIKRASIAVFEISNYYSAGDDNTESSTTNTSYVNKTTLNFTPSATADYVVFATADVNSDTAAKAVWGQMVIDSVQDHEFEMYRSAYANVCDMMRKSFSNAAHTIDINYHATSPATAYIKGARITVVKASDLGTTDYSEQASAVYTSTTDYSATATSITFSPSARGDYLIIACEEVRQENTGYGAYARIAVDGTGYSEHVHGQGRAFGTVPQP